MKGVDIMKKIMYKLINIFTDIMLFGTIALMILIGFIYMGL